MSIFLSLCGVNEMKMTDSFYDHDYFEDGPASGKSGYTNYQWLPDLTIPMAHHLIMNLNIQKNDTLLDYGCAKGYLVRAMRLLGIEAYGVDTSSYAIKCCHESVRDYCFHLMDENFLKGKTNYDYIISKDVFEHIEESELPRVLETLSVITKKIFIVVPLAKMGSNSEFIIPAYHNDKSHITIRDKDWWLDLIGKWFEVTDASHSFRGCKENWTSIYPNGNLFIQGCSRLME